MEKIKIITDSTLDLPADLIKEKGIEVLPLLINFGEESYLDGVEINIHQMLERIEKDNILPTTAQVTPNRFEEVFKKYLDEGYNSSITFIIRNEWNLPISLHSKKYVRK